MSTAAAPPPTTDLETFIAALDPNKGGSRLKNASIPLQELFLNRANIHLGTTTSTVGRNDQLHFRVGLKQADLLGTPSTATRLYMDHHGCVRTSEDFTSYSTIERMLASFEGNVKVEDV